MSGATTVILKSFAQIDGTLLTMSNFGAIGFGTIEPGNGTLEEQISFTGVTQNTNGTATLTGVSSVLMVSPYTASSGLAQTHAGSTTFVISNTSGFYDRLTGKADDEVITGLWQFPNDANTPILGSSYVAPTLNNQVASKGYADSLTFAGAPDATTTQKGIVELATQSEVDAKTATGGTGASLVATPALARSTLLSDYVADTGAADAYVITPAPAISAYTTGQIFTFKAANTNTTTSTLAVNGLTTKTIKKLDGATNLAAGDIVSGQIIQVEYDGTNFQMMNPGAASSLPALSAGVINEFVTTTNGTSFSFGRPFNYQAFTGSGTWTKPTNLSGNEIVVVQLWGAGGGGGTASGSGANPAGAGGGGGGTFLEMHFLASALGSTVAVTIGAGGATDTVGGNTTFGALATAYGGGAGAAATSGAAESCGGGGGGAGGLTVGNDATDRVSGEAGVGASGGSPLGGAASTGNSGFGGGGGGSDNATGGVSANGGSGGGAGGHNTGVCATAKAGGASIWGGGGGGGGGTSGAAGGTSVFGGAGGAGGGNTTGTAGTAPAGGGGGGARNAGGTNAGGAGARGEIRVWVIL